MDNIADLTKDHKKIQYQEAIVTYIDILGFKNMLSNLDANDIYETLNMFHIQHNQNSLSNHENKHETNIYFFSDSVVRVKFTDGVEGWESTATDEVISLAVMQLELFKRGILLRGGCTKGMIYSNAPSNILFGPALVEAYKIESELSVYPRIVISESVWGDYMKDMTTTVHWVKSDYTANRGFDYMSIAGKKYTTTGWKNDIACNKLKRSIILNENYFINYFWGIFTSSINGFSIVKTLYPEYIPSKTKDLIDTIEMFLSLLLSYNNKIENSCTDDSIKIKLLWCRFHLHETVKDIYEWMEGFELSYLLNIDLKRCLAEQTKLFFKKYGTNKVTQQVARRQRNDS
jgi:hypothetical protein